MYNFDTNIPAPEVTKRGRRAKFPFRKMAVGDSFAVDFSDRASAAMSANYTKLHVPGFSYTSRREGDVVRFWRLS